LCCNEESRIIIVTILISHIKLLFLDTKEKEFFYFVKHQLGYTPNDIHYYRKALTHKSANVKSKDGFVVSNERLEYLGDSVLDCILADYLFERYPRKDEGFLTQMRSKIVNRKSLNDIALSFRLNKYLFSSRLSEEASNTMGNAFEALIGAIYLDKGFDFTRQFVIEKVLERHYDFNFLERVDTNFKSRLLEITQRNKHAIAFDTVEKGCDSKGKPIFAATITLENSKLCSASGYSKKDAEQNAAKLALQRLNADV